MPWALAAAAIVAQQVGSKALRDSAFLMRVSASALPHAMLAVAALSVPIVLGVSAAMVRIGPGRVARVLLLANAALFGLEWLLLPHSPVTIAWGLYLHVASLGGTLVSAFFSSFSEQFDPHTGRRAISRVLSGAAIGGLVGGLLAAQVAHAFGERALLLALLALNVGCVLGLPTVTVTAGPTAQPEDARGSAHALSRLRRSPYLRSIATLVLLSGFVSALLDYAFKASAAQALGRGPELTELFANFYTATAVLSTLLQTTLADRTLVRLGLSGTLSILPASVLLGGAFGVVLPPLWSRALLRGLSSVVETSFFRSAYEPLYTPLSPNARRSTKTVIDVAAGRLGEALGSGALLVLGFYLREDMRGACVVLLAALAALLLGGTALRLHAGYVSELTRSLRSGAVRLEQADARDGTTQMTLSLSHAELERSQLLAQIAALRAVAPGLAEAPTAPQLAPPQFTRQLEGERDPSPGTQDAPRSTPAPFAQNPDHIELLAAASDLLSAQRDRVVRRLELAPLDSRLCGLAIPLLQHAALVEPVTAALKAAAPTIVGQLVDALHDPHAPLSVRRRIPRILKAVPQQRAAQGLIEGLRAEQRELRFRSALALGELTVDHPEFAPPSDFVFEAVRTELRPTDEPPVQLQHLFAMLGLVLPRGPLTLARRALGSSDARQRGTALEYLHNVVPEPLRAELLTFLELAKGPAKAPEQGAQ